MGEYGTLRNDTEVLKTGVIDLENDTVAKRLEITKNLEKIESLRRKISIAETGIEENDENVKNGNAFIAEKEKRATEILDGPTRVRIRSNFHTWDMDVVTERLITAQDVKNFLAGTHAYDIVTNLLDNVTFSWTRIDLSTTVAATPVGPLDNSVGSASLPDDITDTRYETLDVLIQSTAMFIFKLRSADSSVLQEVSARYEDIESNTWYLNWLANIDLGPLLMFKDLPLRTNDRVAIESLVKGFIDVIPKPTYAAALTYGSSRIYLSDRIAYLDTSDNNYAKRKVRTDFVSLALKTLNRGTALNVDSPTLLDDVLLFPVDPSRFALHVNPLPAAGFAYTPRVSLEFTLDGTIEMTKTVPLKRYMSPIDFAQQLQLGDGTQFTRVKTDLFGITWSVRGRGDTFPFNQRPEIDDGLDLVYSLTGTTQHFIQVLFNDTLEAEWIDDGMTLGSLSSKYRIRPLGFAVLSRRGKTTEVVYLRTGSVSYAGVSKIALHRAAPSVPLSAAKYPDIPHDQWNNLEKHYGWQKEVASNPYPELSGSDRERLRKHFGDDDKKVKSYMDRLISRHTVRDPITDVPDHGNIEWMRLRSELMDSLPL